MRDLVFEWNKRKASENRRKHGVSFEEARSAFLDENARVIPDPDHSVDESRFVLLGLSVQLRLLLVVHCYRENDAAVRIISARKADRTESQKYSEFMK
ncbi:MAG: BrnT family toxin [Gammaproteobacteria bacterium]|nr:BrnT family toxin [Gammaproteobacteria bacterium]